MWKFHAIKGGRVPSFKYGNGVNDARLSAYLQ